MALHGELGGLSGQAVTDASLAAERRQLGHAIATFADGLLLKLLGLLFQLHNLLFEPDYRGPFLFEQVFFHRRSVGSWWLDPRFIRKMLGRLGKPVLDQVLQYRHIELVLLLRCQTHHALSSAHKFL